MKAISGWGAAWVLLQLPGTCRYSTPLQRQPQPVAAGRLKSRVVTAGMAHGQRHDNSRDKTSVPVSVPAWQHDGRAPHWFGKQPVATQATATVWACRCTPAQAQLHTPAEYQAGSKSKCMLRKLHEFRESCMPMHACMLEQQQDVHMEQHLQLLLQGPVSAPLWVAATMPGAATAKTSQIRSRRNSIASIYVDSYVLHCDHQKSRRK